MKKISEVLKDFFMCIGYYIKERKGEYICNQ